MTGISFTAFLNIKNGSNSIKQIKISKKKNVGDVMYIVVEAILNYLLTNKYR